MPASLSLRRVLGLVCLAALATRPCLAEEARVHGRVLGQTEQGEHLGPVANAKVEFLSGGKSVASVNTDAGGYYQIRNLKPGQFEYHLVASGFREEKEGRGFELKTDGASVLDFVVTKESAKKDPEKKPDNTKPSDPKPDDPKNPNSKKPKTPNTTPPEDDDPNAAAPPGEGLLRVRVMAKGEDGTNSPVSGATVKVRPSAGGSIRTTSTGRGGGSRFDVAPGGWRIAAVAPGYEMRTHPPVTVPADGRAAAIIVLSKKPDPSTPVPPGQTAASDPAATETNSSFFGAKGAGNRVAYLVDASNSMRGEKFDQAAAELMKSVRALSDRQKFYVIFFSDTLHPMFEPEAPADMVPADWLNVTRLDRSVTDMKTKLGTNAKEAAEKAFSLKPDVIYILSDGAFTDTTRRYLLQQKEGQIPIHTIGFRSSDRGADSLKAISDKNHGTYTEVP